MLTIDLLRTISTVHDILAIDQLGAGFNILYQMKNPLRKEA